MTTPRKKVSRSKPDPTPPAPPKETVDAPLAAEPPPPVPGPAPVLPAAPTPVVSPPARDVVVPRRGPCVNCERTSIVTVDLPWTAGTTDFCVMHLPSHLRYLAS